MLNAAAGSHGIDDLPAYPLRIIARDRRRDYGEVRYRLLGMIDGRVYVVVYTTRGSTIRIISARQGQT